MLSKFFNLIFPTVCIVCEQTGPDLCQKCINSFKVHKPSNYPWVMSLWDYHDPNVETLMRYIKSCPNKRLAKILARQFTIKNTHDYIVPIPIGYTRFISRGYNQTELLAKPLGRKLKLPLIKNVLYKKHATKKQGTARSKQDRKQNLKDSFGIKNPHLIKDKDVLLIDDITTTGSTLIEARNVLLKSGARSVNAVTIAN